MPPRIAIPVPHSQRTDYNARSLPMYKHAVTESGGEPVEVALDLSNEQIATLISTCQGVLLPGSPADVDPQKFNAEKHAKTNAADSARDNVDELLLQDAYNMHKPVLGICYGLQSLNVWRSGTLRQHIADAPVDHEDKKKPHGVNVEPDSLLAEIVDGIKDAAGLLPVNSSHHQSAEVAGDGLRIVARCPADGVIEAVEGTAAGHFVLGVQWHPERGFDSDPASQAIFRRFVEEARAYTPRPVK